jgi:hypothetical protein
MPNIFGLKFSFKNITEKTAILCSRLEEAELWFSGAMMIISCNCMLEFFLNKTLTSHEDRMADYRALLKKIKQGEENVSACRKKQRDLRSRLDGAVKKKRDTDHLRNELAFTDQEVLAAESFQEGHKRMLLQQALKIKWGATIEFAAKVCVKQSLLHC